LLFGLWIAFSGNFLAEFLVIGAITAAAAVAFSELLFRGTHEGRFASAPTGIGWFVRSTVRFLVYLLWLSYQIVASNVHVVYLILHPRLPINPSLVEFNTTLVSERAQVMLAQSITLTPGTVTVDASDGKFVVHCLSDFTRAGLSKGTIQNKVAAVFGEPSSERVELHDIERPGQVPL
jgi:multicomponent Na+:H+ antiporter subunit E